MSKVIKPEEIQIGDTIRVSLKFNYDMEVTRKGIVARIREDGGVREYGTMDHAVLLVTPNLRESNVVVELLHRTLTLPCEISWDDVRVDDKVRVDFKDGSITGTVVDVNENIFLDITGIDIEILPGDPEKITLLERENR